MSAEKSLSKPLHDYSKKELAGLTKQDLLKVCQDNKQHPELKGYSGMKKEEMSQLLLALAKKLKTRKDPSVPKVVKKDTPKASKTGKPVPLKRASSPTDEKNVGAFFPFFFLLLMRVFALCVYSLTLFAR